MRKRSKGRSFTEADTWEAFDQEVLQSKVPVIVDFWAPWCAPCRMVAPQLEVIADGKGEAVKIVKVNVDKNREAAFKYQIASIPTIGLYRDGELKRKSVGAKPARMIEADLKI